MPEDTAEMYAQSFEKFLSHTNEKQVFIDEITDYVNQHQARSLLDIGAGNGSLAIPLSRKVAAYVAIEPKPKYAAKLRDASLRVIEQRFPTAVDGTYDLVLMSHVISYTLGNHAILIPAAWKLVRPNGHLLVVTHRGSERDDWGRLLEAVGLGETGMFTTSFDDIVRLLGERGPIQMQKVVTTLETSTTVDMVQAMAFVASNGSIDRYQRFLGKSKELQKVLSEKYRTETGFSFPYLHLFVSAQKAA